MPKNAILLALKSKSETDSLSTGMKAVGFEILTASDGVDAMEKALLEQPSLVIADTALPVLDGERLFKVVRGNVSTSKIPFIIITDRVVDLKGFMSGLDIFLTRPFDPEEVLLIASKALLQKESPEIEGKVINGDLSHMSLPDILQFLNMNKKEGKLRVASGESSATFYIKGGEVYNAVLEVEKDVEAGPETFQAGAPVGAIGGYIEKEKAVYRSLAWTKGSFEFTPSVVTSSKKIRSNTSNLVMEGMRQLDEMKKRRGEFPDGRSLLRVKKGLSELPKGLHPLIYEIIENSKTHPRVDDLVDSCTHPDYEVYAALANMNSRGIIEVMAAPAAFREGLLGKDETASLMERLRGRLVWGLQQESSKIMLLSENRRLVDSFIAATASIPGFGRRHTAFFSEASIGEEMGEVASLRLEGGYDLVVFSVPNVRRMGPIVSAFSSNAAAMILLYGGADSREVLKAREELLKEKKIPAVHVISGEAARKTPEEIRKAAGLRSDEPVFLLTPGAKTPAREIFQVLFSSILKEEA